MLATATILFIEPSKDFWDDIIPVWSDQGKDVKTHVSTAYIVIEVNLSVYDCATESEFASKIKSLPSFSNVLKGSPDFLVLTDADTATGIINTISIAEAKHLANAQRKAFNNKLSLILTKRLPSVEMDLKQLHRDMCSAAPEYHHPFDKFIGKQNNGRRKHRRF